MKVDTYMRPDNTELDREVGPGETTGPRNGCSTVIQTPIWNLVSDTTSRLLFVSNCPGGDFNLSQRKCEYRGTRILSRDDGAEITEQSTSTYLDTKTNSICTNQNNVFPDFPPPCGDPLTGSLQIEFNQSEGW